GSTYTYLSDYRGEGKAEETGIIGKIGFKVLKAENTTIRFEETSTMPDSKEGTYMFDWYGDKLYGYTVIQPDAIIADIEEPTATPTETVEPTATPTPTETVEPTAEPTALPDSYVIMELDKTRVVEGDVIIATVRVNNMKTLGGYQLSIKYDPTVLQAFNIRTGNPISTRTWPAEEGTIQQNTNYGPTKFIGNNVSEGILNFGSTYTYMSDYREAGKPEETGLIGKIGFKVLKAENTAIRFEGTSAMPNSKEGTYMFDWYGDRMFDYAVIQPEPIIAGSDEPTATPTESVEPTATPTETVEPTPTPTKSVEPTPTETVEPTDKPTELPDAYVSMELDKTKVKVGDIIAGTIKIENMKNFGGYQ
ncbi:cohesin domain-containing protein, partial [Acetivibrio straminisolvens]|uniref:cohesin domain-containing protein n=1 Tax=Acetivibrio straminisolvens TaxID=253314 RepID=UPI0022402C5D